jgi:HAMP domain-containing protein
VAAAARDCAAVESGARLCHDSGEQAQLVVICRIPRHRRASARPERRRGRRTPRQRRGAQGRVFTQNDERALDADPAVVLGYAYWQRAFGGDPRVIGGILHVERGTSLQPLRILGVLPKSFRDLDPATDRDLWMPVTAWAQLNGRSEIDARDYRWFDILGRLAPGVSVKQADAEIGAMATGFVRDYPAVTVDRGGRVQTDASYRFERVGAAAGVMLALVLILVAITSVNVAQLLLSRAVTQRRELAVRVALGASRGRVLRERLIEVGLLGALGAAVGLAVGAWLLHLLPLIVVTPPGLQAFAVFTLDSRVVIFALATALLSTLAFGLAPSWTASRTELATLIKAETGGSGAGRRFGMTPRSALLIGQVAVSLVLVYAGAMLVRSFEATRQADLGFTRSPVLTVWVPFGDAPRGLIAEAQQRLEALPGVEHVAAAIRAPLSLSAADSRSRSFFRTRERRRRRA